MSFVRKRNQHGYSIMGVMVAVAVSSVAILGLYKAVAQVIEAQSFIKTMDKVRLFSSQLEVLLTQPSYCTQSFSSIRLQDGQLGEYQDVDLKFRTINSDLSPGPIFAQKGQDVGKGLKVSKFQLRANLPAGGNTFVGSLRMAFNNPGNRYAKVVTHEVPLTLEMTLNGGQRTVSSCQAGRGVDLGGGGTSGGGNPNHASGATYGSCYIKFHGIMYNEQEDGPPLDKVFRSNVAVSSDGTDYKSPISDEDRDPADKPSPGSVLVSAADSPFTHCDVEERNGRIPSKSYYAFNVACEAGYQVVLQDQRTIRSSRSNTSTNEIYSYSCKKTQ